VENELPRFQRFDRYPTELGKDRDRCKESSLDSTSRGDGSFACTGELPGAAASTAPAFLSTSSEELPGLGSDAAGDVGFGFGNDTIRNGEGWNTPDELYGIGSEDRNCMPPYLRAAISCGESGRDFLRSFCRRFWNHI